MWRKLREKNVDPPVLPGVGVGLTSQARKMICPEIRRKNSEEGQGPHRAVERMMTMMMVMVIMMN
jgi:hypothetical protein